MPLHTGCPLPAAGARDRGVPALLGGDGAAAPGLLLPRPPGPLSAEEQELLQARQPGVRARRGPASPACAPPRSCCCLASRSATPRGGARGRAGGGGAGEA